MSRRLLILFIFLGACAMPPKTANEFRSISKERKGQHLVTVGAPLETVISRINVHAEKCTNFGWTITRREGMGGNPAASKYSDRQMTRWERAGTDKPSFVIALEGKQDLNKQKGGFFAYIMDLERKGDQTVVKMYDYNFSWGYYDYSTEFKSVVKGEKATCQLEKSR